MSFFGGTKKKSNIGKRQPVNSSSRQTRGLKGVVQCWQGDML